MAGAKNWIRAAAKAESGKEIKNPNPLLGRKGSWEDRGWVPRAGQVLIKICPWLARIAVHPAFPARAVNGAGQWAGRAGEPLGEITVHSDAHQ
jgi:hypothetical protein